MNNCYLLSIFSAALLAIACGKEDQSQKLNFIRWPILNSYEHMNPQVSGSYSGEVKVVKDYITGRLKSFDQLVKL